MSRIAPDTPLAALASSLEGAAPLPHLGVISVVGEDAASFLHGQLTQDISGLPLGEARLAGYCSPKGRLLASLLVWRESADRLLLLCSADVLGATLKRLSMFVLRAKARLADASAELAALGLVGTVGLPPEAPRIAGACASHEGGTLIRLGDVGGQARHLWVGPVAQAAAVASQWPVLDPDNWLWLEAESGVPRIVAATADQFVPQMVNLESVGGVNFKKGCYPGQEVVARSQFRGTLKRRAFVVHGQAPLAPGQELFHSGDATQPCGMVVLAAPDPRGGWAGLAELKLSATEGGTVHAGAAGGPVLRCTLPPYPLLTDI
jgi:tRNA-modifying protein YgfZ